VERNLVRFRAEGSHVKFPLFVAALLVGQTAKAERPLTYTEVLRAAVQANPALSRAGFSEQEAEASLMASRGIFDPNFGVDVSWRNAKFRGIDQQLGFPFEGSNQRWNLTNSLNGSTSTGTAYSLSAGLTNDSVTSAVSLGGGSTLDSEQRQYESNATASITQQLLRGVIAKYNLQNVTLSRQNYTVAQLGTERSRQETLSLAAENYWNWVYQSNLRDIGLESVAVAEEALRVGRLKVEAGELAPVEETRLEAALVQSQSMALDSYNAAEMAANAMLLVMGESPDQEIIPATQPGDVMPMELDLASATEVALAQNLDIAVARANRDTAEMQQAVSKHGRLPSLSATVSGGVSGLSNQARDINGAVTKDASASEALGNLTGTDSQPFMSVGGNFTVPLGNRAARGEADRAGYAVYRTRSDLEELERSVVAQVEEQVRTLDSARRKVELADANLRLAEVTLKAEEALSDAGRSIQKDVLEARNEVTRTKAEATKARTDYRVALVVLRKLQGQLEEDVP